MKYKKFKTSENLRKNRSSPFLAFTGVDFFETLSACAETTPEFFFFDEVAVVAVAFTEFELSTEINEMSDLSDLVEESVSRLRRFFSSGLPST